VNDQWYQSLSGDLKQIVRNAANVGKVCGRGITKIYESSDKGMAVIQKKTRVNQLSIMEKEKFGEVTIPAMKEFIKKHLDEEGLALQYDFLKAINEARVKLGY
jgi:TRAP-type C4-dicarboxylate transport system substrate-binding protein